MNFLQLVLGLGGFLCNYSCPWCRVDKNQRDDMTKPLDFYHTRGMQRTSQNLKEDVVKNYNVLLVFVLNPMLVLSLNT